MIDFESKIKIQDISAWMDGGSISIKCRNELNQEFEIEFVQNVFWELYESQKTPGRIYSNGYLIDQRSHLEYVILDSLSKASIRLNHSLDQQMLNSKIEYVRSEDYLTDQSRIKKVKRKE